MADGKGRIDVMALLGTPAKEEQESTPSSMAAKAMWKAIKRDDEDGFIEALDEYCKYMKPDKAADDTDD
jgi:hypothetical protein